MSTLITLSNQIQTPVAPPGTSFELMVLYADSDECAGIDLDTGAFVRGHWPESATSLDLQPYLQATAVVAVDDAPADPSRPEAVAFTGPPDLGGRVPHRKARSYIDALMAPTRIPLLGFLGPSIRFWQMSGTHPSLSLLRPTQGPQLIIEDETVKARFEWDGQEQVLEVSNERIRAAALGAGSLRLAGETLATVLGYPPRYMLVGLTRPQDGYCHKVAAAILPKP